MFFLGYYIYTLETRLGTFYASDVRFIIAKTQGSD